MERFLSEYDRGLLAEPAVMPSVDPYGLAATGLLFAPGAGIADLTGNAPDPSRPGQMLPSFYDNISGGNYLDAGLQALGGAGDAVQMMGAAFPPALAVGAAMKAPRAAKATTASVDELRRQANIERFGYDPNEMPSGLLTEPEYSYRMDHQPIGPQDGAARLDDMTGGGEVFPDDIYSSNALRFYGGNNPADQESLRVIQSVRGDPDAEVTIYRGVPKDVDVINSGDWVTLSRRYAQDHAEYGYGADGDQAGKVISQKVKVKDIFSGGNDLNEFGYFPEDNQGIMY